MLRHASSPLDTLGNVTEDTLLDAIDKMEKAVEHVQSQFTTVRTGRASPALVEKLHGRLLRVDGADPAARRLSGTRGSPADRQAARSRSLGAIEKAIRDSDLGVSPSNDGVIIRLNFPPLTEERRKEFVKIVKNMAEDGRIAVRNIRRDARKHLDAAEKSAEISANELERAEKEIERITHEHVEMIDKAFGRKEQELLEV